MSFLNAVLLLELCEEPLDLSLHCGLSNRLFIHWSYRSTKYHFCQYIMQFRCMSQICEADISIQSVRLCVRSLKQAYKRCYAVIALNFFGISSTILLIWLLDGEKTAGHSHINEESSQHQFMAMFFI